MSDWDRKQLLVTADAIKHCIDAVDLPKTAMVVELEKVYDLANKSAKCVVDASENLESVRRQLCATFRKNTLYECDVQEGWSTNCAFMRHNADR